MIKAGIIGGTGYTGVELLRLLHNHAQVEVIAISSRSEAGQLVGEFFPSLAGQTDLAFTAPNDVILDKCDVVFFATPHGVAMETAGTFIDKGIKVIDLGPDFRLRDKDEYAQWYGLENFQDDLLASSVYGLSEINREQIKEAQLIGNPGCFPTTVLLALKPLIEKNLIDLSNIVVDSKTGVSGAGRGANQAMLLCETSESVKAYGVSGHRHYPEIKQELSLLAGGKPIGLTFVPHLVPMIRGMESTIYVDLLDANVDVQSILEAAYKDEHFVTVLGAGVVPETRNVKSSNFCQIAAQKAVGGKLVVTSVIDNLIKGAAGQAIQNMNIMFDIDEGLGLEQIGLLP
ncbi:MAG TPA: N-acetyl-gamma-glutamyl-phosphate reductase [Gammaproteobacteria bacterium]|jgi:N-acetyl-gamma-glutamyl-phosphate reductase|uniref:N-acetyl-gamma-glutamyl-phosphate reductase n=1 Tax=hydrothermal vent metagenome TaxID=652676 RepID=A0A1W1DMX6_9ZZZZ|nr:N-acetyl-gamma-glutamyl-phosphate reductase [Gammaproteobacteria bacterium]HAE04873.1 N-acetyl-gamma-glutamyl-phosphate reductase [Gammaproteobacteria bacterium]HAE73065.1 N-acetyl-gamma-glutamyl-phosphate reductase [Gammaproteobacteria bacterium]HAG47721.1 N-acetyl-gamma-glutamyl-phosphate reductase [Gammaproteobacteria bacterium]HAN33217.1 N-acetyl-gamma-glutamyl-phosphate reductase [Gammaproteobacteria bacterium]